MGIKSFKDKAAVITGGGSALGQASPGQPAVRQYRHYLRQAF
jgi:hypothetical protein